MSNPSRPEFSLLSGDCRKILPTLPENFADAIVTDPPYELGFMGKTWDRSGVAFQPETWEAALRVAKPGAMLLAFGGTRTFHRLTCAIEDAGWEIRDCLMWLYGSGFPKSHNVSKAIEAHITTGRSDSQVTGDGRSRLPGQHYTEFRRAKAEKAEFVPTQSLAHTFNGYGTALKPAWEPIILAMKPLDGTFAANAEKWGVAGVNVEGCRVGLSGGTRKAGPPSRIPGHSLEGSLDGSLNGGGVEALDKGRWPANLIFDEEAGAMLDEQTGGGPSRFFYCAKASKSDRGEGNNHPTVKPRSLMRWLCRLVKMPGETVILDPFIGSGSTGVAALLEGCLFVGVDDTPAYLEIARGRLREHGQEEILTISS